jgi:hypothetical protein
MVNEDLRNPERIISNPDLRALIDYSEPALCMSLVLHFVPPGSDPYGIVNAFQDALAAGSYMVLSHATSDGRDADTITEITNTYSKANAPLVMRSQAEVERFFDGFDLVEPGVVFISQWRPTAEYYAQGGTRWAYAGVGMKGIASCGPGRKP